MRILIIEDDPPTAHSMRLMLAAENMTARVTGTGTEGMQLALKHNYDVVLLDLNLPDVSGYKVLMHLRAAELKTPIIIVSGLARIKDQAQGLNLGADMYLTKPFHKDLLVAYINAVARRANNQAQSVIQVGDLSVNLSSRTAAVRCQ